MLLKIGQRNKVPEDVVDLLLACHDRIRSFAALARKIGERTEASADEVTDACLRVERYFTESLPLHVCDEEESLLPRLLGRSAEVDRALDRMKVEHATHEYFLGRLANALSAVRQDPKSREMRAALVVAADQLARTFVGHLTFEEAVLFPAIRRYLTPAMQTDVMNELRHRRDENRATKPKA